MLKIWLGFSSFAVVIKAHNSYQLASQNTYKLRCETVFMLWYKQQTILNSKTK